MNIILDMCFMCTKDYNCVQVDNNIVSQIEYLLPEITIIKLGIPLRICSACDMALCSFSKFKKSSVESSRRLEASIKGAQGLLLHIGSPPVVDDNETSGVKLEKEEEVFIKEENVEETPMDTQMHTDRASLKPIDLLETISAEPQNKYMQLFTDTIVENIEIFIKEEPTKETSQDRELNSNALKEECVSNPVKEDTDSQPEHNTEDESTTFNTSENNWGEEKSLTDFEQETVEETDGNCTKNIQTDTKKTTDKTINQNKLKKNIQEKKEHRCNICTELFECDLLLARHMKEKHFQIKVLLCTICKKIFFNEYYLKKHMDLHDGIKNYPGSTIAENTKQIFKEEQMEETSQNRELYCNILKDTDSQPEHNTSLDSNEQKSEEQERSTDFTQETLEETDGNCTKNIQTFTKKTMHRTINQDQIKNIQNTKGQLKVELEHNTKDERTTYKTSEKVGEESSADSEEETIEKANNSGVKDFQCDLCETSFTHIGNFNAHMNFHFNVKDFQCRICEKSFTKKNTLNSHMIIHSGNCCKVCGKTFAHRFTLRRHIKLHIAKKFQCEICAISFTHKVSLIMHQKDHFEVKKFQCELCEKSFTQIGHLNYHKKSHSKIKEFRCEICNKLFRYECILKTHMKLHSRV